MASVDLQVRFSSAATSLDQTVNVQVEAIDDIMIELAAGAKDREIAIQPGSASKIEALALQNTAVSAGVSYRADPAASPIPLIGAHLYIGPAMTALLDPNPVRLFFSNSGPDPVNVRVVVGRNT